MTTALLDFVFPIYRLSTSFDYKTDNNIVYAIRKSDKNISIVDNKNLSGDTLASRRLRIPKKDLFIKLRAVFTFSQLIKKHASKTMYIDKTGKLFRYKKSIKAPLIYRRILDHKNIDNYGTAITVQGIDIPIIVPAGTIIEGYIGLLEYKGGYLLYDIVENRKEDTWRII